MKDGVRHIFNPKGLHTQTIDRNNNITTYTYDEDGRLISIEDPVGQITTLNYTGWHLSSITDPAGRTTHFYHNDKGDLIEITNPDGTMKRFTYDGRHLLTERIDERGNRTSYIYDRYGRIIEVHSPDYEVFKDEVLVRDRRMTIFKPIDTQDLLNDLPEGVGTEDNPAPVIRPRELLYEVEEGCCGNGKRIGRTDRFGAVIEETDALGRTTYIERDRHSNPTRITHPNGAITQMSYDEIGNLLSSAHSTERYRWWIIFVKTSFTYDPTFNQLTSITDPNGNVTQIEYDDRGNPIRIIDALGNTTTMEYDHRGLLVKTIDALGNTTTFSYDSKGNLISTIDPLGNTTTLEYDSAGNIVSSIDPLGRITHFEYDLMNRLLRVIDPAGGVTHYEYDEAGNLTSIIDANGNRTRFTYNELNQLTRIINPLGGEKRFYYDIRGNLVRTIDPNNQVIDYEYDQVGQLISKRTPDNTYTYSYDEVGNLTSLIENDSNLSFSYDLANRLIKAITNPTIAQPSTTISYEYDKAGNRINMAYPGEIMYYTYDALNRLIYIGEKIGYTYDQAGRRTKLRFEKNEITYTYDASGNILSINAKDPPIITHLEPSSANRGDMDLRVSVYGDGFIEGADIGFLIRVGDDSMPDFAITIKEIEYISPKRIDLLIDVGEFAEIGPRDVVVTNPDGGSFVLESGFFIEEETLTIRRIEPIEGPRGSRDLVITIYGSNFDEGIEVGFSGDGITIRDISLHIIIKDRAFGGYCNRCNPWKEGSMGEEPGW
jgi:YD repeat-containing protein